jgi:hypothetical protein
VALSDELLPASFKGVPFLVNSGSTEGGRKTATHEFPNSDRRFVEDLGLLNKKFSVQATITGPNYRQKRDALINAIETAGSGLLIHPFLGIQRVVSKPYTLEERMTNVGEARFNLVFENAQDAILPRPIRGTLSNIFSSVNQAITLVKTTIIQAINISNSDNYLDALGKTLDFIDSVGFLTNEYVSTSEQFDTFSKGLQNFSENASQIVTDAVLLSDNYADTFTNLDDALSSPEGAMGLFGSLYSFGDDDVTIEGNTFQNNIKENNRDILNGATQTLALLLSYRNAVKIEYQTVDQINQQQEALDIQFEKINSNSAVISSDRSELLRARNQVREFFDQAELQAFKVIDFTTNTTTISELVYRIYGNLDNLNTIIELNGFRDLQRIEGTIKILSK